MRSLCSSERISKGAEKWVPLDWWGVTQWAPSGPMNDSMLTASLQRLVIVAPHLMQTLKLISSYQVVNKTARKTAEGIKRHFWERV